MGLLGRLSSEEADFVTEGEAVGNIVEGVCSAEEIGGFFVGWGARVAGEVGTGAF